MRNIYETIMKPENKEFIQSLFSIDRVSGTLEIDIDRYHDEIEKHPGLELPMITINAGKITDDMGFSLSSSGSTTAKEFNQILSRVKLFDGTGFVTMDNIMTVLVNNSKIPVTLFTITKGGLITNKEILHNPETGELCKILPIDVNMDRLNNNMMVTSYFNMTDILPEKPYKEEFAARMSLDVISNPNDFVESAFWYVLQNLVVDNDEDMENILSHPEFEGWELININEYKNKFTDPTFVQQLVTKSIY